MSAVGNVVLNDAAGTPLAHTFSPGKQGLVGSTTVQEYENRASNSGVPEGFEKLVLEFGRPVADRKSYKVRVKLTTPILETPAGSTVPVLAHTELFDGVFTLPTRASLQNRKDLRKMVYEALNATVVKQAIEDLDPPY